MDPLAAQESPLDSRKSSIFQIDPVRCRAPGCQALLHPAKVFSRIEVSTFHFIRTYVRFSKLNASPRVDCAVAIRGSINALDMESWMSKPG